MWRIHTLHLNWISWYTTVVCLSNDSFIINKHDIRGEQRVFVCWRLHHPQIFTLSVKQPKNMSLRKTVLKWYTSFSLSALEGFWDVFVISCGISPCLSSLKNNKYLAFHVHKMHHFSLAGFVFARIQFGHFAVCYSLFRRHLDWNRLTMNAHLSWMIGGRTSHLRTLGIEPKTFDRESNALTTTTLELCPVLPLFMWGF